MFFRKTRLLQVLCTLMMVTVILPILFNVFISRAYPSSMTTAANNPLVDSFPLYAPREHHQQQSTNHLDPTSNGSKVNLTNLMAGKESRANVLSIVGSSLEEQVSFGFADLTNRLRYAESVAGDSRQEISQLMKEIRYLWEIIQQQRQSQSTNKTIVNLNSTDVTAKGKYLCHSTFCCLPSIW